MIWMQHKHIPEVLATGKFTTARLVRVLIEEEMGGVTYSTQYTTDSKETLEKYYRRMHHDFVKKDPNYLEKKCLRLERSWK
jgi:hypothetical protein